MNSKLTQQKLPQETKVNKLLYLAVDFPKEEFVTSSYGIVLHQRLTSNNQEQNNSDDNYNASTDKFLILRRSETREYLTIISGIYAIAELVHLCSRITLDEADRLRKIDDDLTYSFECEKLNVKNNWKVFNSKRDYLIKSIELYVRDNQLEWSWPKGKKNTCESARCAAVRELSEETGIFIPEKEVKFIGKDAEYISYKNKKCNNVYYYYSINKKVNVTLTYETSEYKWCTYEELNEHLPQSTFIPNLDTIIDIAENQ